VAQIFTNAPRENLNILSLFVGHPTFNLSPQVCCSSDAPSLGYTMYSIYTYIYLWYGVMGWRDDGGVPEASEIHSCVSIIYIQIKTKTEQKTPKGNLCQGSSTQTESFPILFAWQMMSLLPFSCGAALCLFWHLGLHDYMDLWRSWPINYPDIWHMYMPVVVVAPVKIAGWR